MERQDQLGQIESQSHAILREAFRQCDRLAALRSVGNGSAVNVWRARQEFLGAGAVPPSPSGHQR